MTDVAERDEAFVACPYYLGLNNMKQRAVPNIRCEGVSQGNTISLIFGDENVRKKYKRDFCYSIKGCRHCHIHQMLNRKYGVNDEI